MSSPINSQLPGVGKFIQLPKTPPASSPRESEPEAPVDQVTTSSASTSSPEAAPAVAGCQRQVLEDGTVQLSTVSGLKVLLDPQGKVNRLEVPNEGVINRQEDGKLKLTTAEGLQLPVEGYADPKSQEFDGYRFIRPDKTMVNISLSNLTTTYVLSFGPPRGICQELHPNGSQHILATSVYDDGGQQKLVRTNIKVHSDGSFASQDPSQEVQLSAQNLRFKNPLGETHSIKLLTSIPSLAKEDSPPPAPGEAPQPNPNQPIVMETPPPKVEVHATLPNQSLFHRDAEGTTAIQLRNGLTLTYKNGEAKVRDPRGDDGLIAASIEDYQAADGRKEKTFKFQDLTGVKYQLFNKSMDFLVESPDGRVRQHVLPNGTILGQVQGEDGKFFRFEVNPQGQARSDKGLVVPYSSLDGSEVYLQGPDGQIPVQLPYPIPNDQASAQQYINIHGSYPYPTSGQKLSAFQGNNKPPQGQPPQEQPPQWQPPQWQPPQGQPPQWQPPQGQPPQWQPPQGQPPQWQPPQGNLPPFYNPGPSFGFPNPDPWGVNPGVDPSWGGGWGGPSVFPQPGCPQLPIQPNFMQRLRYLFSGDPRDLQPRGYPMQPPNWMGGYPSFPYPSYPTPPYAGGSPPWGNPQYPRPNYPSNPGYPGPSQGTPGFTGQTPTFPGQMAHPGDYYNQLQQQFQMSQAAMWSQLGGGGGSGMGMWPTSSFYNSPWRPF